MNFPSQIFFNDINYGYRGSILKKNSLWLLPFYIVVATYFCYEKVRRTMRNAMVLNLLQLKNMQKYKLFYALMRLEEYFEGYCPENFFPIVHLLSCPKRTFL